MPNNFLSKYDTFEKRQSLCNHFKNKHPTRIPIVVTLFSDKSQYKYLVPRHVTMGNFIGIFRNSCNINSSKALFFLCNNILLPVSRDLIVIYDEMADRDGFLYITAKEENVFGTN